MNLQKIKDFILGEPIPEKVLTLLLSGDQESIDLAFTLLDLTTYDLTKPYTMVKKKQRLVKRLKRELKNKGFEIRFIIDDTLSYVERLSIKAVDKLTVRPVNKFRPIIK